MAGIIAAHDLKNKSLKLPPENTAHGSLLKHITMNANPDTFQPMNINFGLFPNIENSQKNKKIDKKLKRKAISEKSISLISEWSKNLNKII